jgi:hypothetical protein
MRDRSAPQPNTPARYNAQPYAADPAADEWTPVVVARRWRRAKKWLDSIVDKGATAPRHIQEDIERFKK